MTAKERKARVELYQAATALLEKLNDVLDIVIEQEREER